MRIRQWKEGIAAVLLLPWTLLGVGGSLVIAGMRKRSVLGGVLAAAGGALLHRAIVRPAPHPTDRRPLFARGLAVKKTILVHCPPEKCYRFWRDLEKLSDIMDHVQSVRVLSPKRSRWVATSIGGTSIEWDAEIVKDVPGRIIGWRSLPGWPLQTAGSVRFEPENDGTRVIVTLKYEPPAGMIGTALAELLGESPSKQIGTDLEHFKAIMEGEVDPGSDTVEGSPEGTLHAGFR